MPQKPVIPNRTWKHAADEIKARHKPKKPNMLMQRIADMERMLKEKK